MPKTYIGGRNAQQTLKKLDAPILMFENRAHLSPCTKINSEWFNDLNVIHESLKLLQEIKWKQFYCRHKQFIFEQDSTSSGFKSQHSQMGSHHIEKLLHIKNNYQNKETAYRLEKLFQLLI
jgi:hypothetical protein